MTSERTLEDLQAGARIGGRYVVVAKLGAGGMGTVYRARDEQTGRDVAVKVMRESESTKLRAARRFDREAHATLSLDPTRVAEVLDVGETGEGARFIVMALVPGATLREALLGRTLAPERALHIVHEIATTLGTAHAAGIVHRDVKPDNVMLTPDGRVVVLDFGLAKPLAGSGDASRVSTRLTADGALLGTLAYAAPEQSMGEEVVPATDQFALAVTTFELLTGQLPWTTCEPVHVLAQVLAGQPRSLRAVTGAVHARLDPVLARALAKNPRDRFASIEAYADALDAAWRGAATSASSDTLEGVPEGAVARVMPPSNGTAKAARGRARLAVSALAIAAAATLSIFAVSRSTRRSPAPSPSTLAPSVPASAAVPWSLRRLTANVPENPIRSAGLSPDGDTLAWVDKDGVSLMPIGGTAQHATFALPGAAQIVAWFPDGDRLAVCVATGEAEQEDLWFVSRSNASPPRKVCRAPFTGIAVSPDGTRIAYAANDTVGWLSALDGDAGALHPLVRDDKSFVTEVTFSPDGGRIAYASFRFDSLANTAIETVSVDPLDGPRVPGVVVVDPHLFNSFVRAAGVVWSADGEIVYPRTEWLPAEAGSNLWSVKVDARSGAPTSPPHRLTRWAGVGVAALSASAHGDRIAFLRFDSQADVYIADVQSGGRALGARRRLTLSDRNERPSAWSRDGRGVYFFSDATGNFDIDYQEIDGGPARPFAADSAWETSAQLSPDGESLLYWRFPAVISDDAAPAAAPPGVRPEIVRRAVAGGPAEHVLTSKTLAHPAGAGRPAPWETRMRCTKRAGLSCVLSETDEDGALVFTAFDPKGGRGAEIFRIKRPTAASAIWDVSPDGARLAIPQANGPILLQPLRGSEPPREVSVPGCDPITPAFSADGEGLFVSVDCDADEPPMRLYFIDARGKPSLLWAAPSVFILEAEPSPDGKHLAIAVRPTDDDVWMTERAERDP